MSSNVRTDDSALSRADQFLFKIESAMTLVAGLSILAIMLLAVANILGRKFFNLPVPGFIDWIVQAVPIIAFLGIAYCQRLGNHIRMDMLVGALKGRILWAFELFSIVLMGALTVILTMGSWSHADRAIRLGDSTIDINLPTWPVKLLVPIMFTLLLARLLLQAWGYWKALWSGEKTPVAVPLIEDTATLAAHEAETVSGIENGS